MQILQNATVNFLKIGGQKNMGKNENKIEQR